MKNAFLYSILLSGVSLLGFSLMQAFDLEASILRGKEIYNGQCANCHMTKGEGIETIYPPLAKSDFLMNETEKSIAFIIKGASEAITVNGIQYNGEMPAFSMTNEQVSDVLNYIRNTWGNKGEPIKPDQVKEIRK